MMKNNSPIHIVMTPVRNEAWILNAFLETTSRWADHIIIADQMSSDGSREIALSYPKVILIDNKNPDFNEAERQKMLIDKAREISKKNSYDNVFLWGLDADEILSANYNKTSDWQKILKSEQGSVFFFQWAEICPDKRNAWMANQAWYPWLFHDDGKEPHGNYVRDMHSMRIPYPIEEKRIFYVHDFRVLHLNYVNTNRVKSKMRFYSFVDWEMNRRSVISLYRSYAASLNRSHKTAQPIPAKYLYSTASGSNIDLLREIDCSGSAIWMDKYISDRINNYDLSHLSHLCIWDQNFLQYLKLKDPRNILIKMLHLYLQSTMKYKSSLLIRGVDKILKEII